jgi:hypothetical protein
MTEFAVMVDVGKAAASRQTPRNFALLPDKYSQKGTKGSQYGFARAPPELGGASLMHFPLST